MWKVFDNNNDNNDDNDDNDANDDDWQRTKFYQKSLLVFGSGQHRKAAL